MPFAGYDNFSDLSGWGNSGMAASGGRVAVVTPNATPGYLAKAFAPGLSSQALRVAFDLTVSKTTGTGTAVGTFNQYANEGLGAGYCAGTGLCYGGVYTFAGHVGFHNTVPLLADASVTDGHTYHFEVVFHLSFASVAVRIYDGNSLVAAGYGGVESTTDWTGCDYLMVQSDTASGVSQVAWDANIFGSAASAPNLKAAAWASDGNANYYLPGGGPSSTPRCGLYYHGAGVGLTDVSADPWVAGLLAQGIPVAQPSESATTYGNAWANAASQAETVAVTNFVATNLGTNVAWDLFGYSMGGLMALSVIGRGSLPNVRSATVKNPVCDLPREQQDVFPSDVASAWGISPPANYAAAQAAFAASDPHQLLPAHPLRYKAITYAFDYVSSGDSTVPPANQVIPFLALMDAAGISYRVTSRPNGAHTDPTPAGVIARALAEIAAAPQDSPALLALLARVPAATPGAAGGLPVLDGAGKLQVTGDVAGKVLGGGSSSVAGVGAWSLDATGQALATHADSAALATASALAAVQTSVTNLNNLSALANLFSAATFARPASGSVAYPLTLAVKDAEGHAVDLDSNAVTLTAANAAGADRSANLSAVTHSATGEYQFSYTVSSAAADEGLRITAAGTVGASPRKAYASAAVADADSLAALAAIQAKTDTIGTNTADSPNAIAAQATIAANASVTHSGTAQAGAASTITLAAGASATDSLYKGQSIRITGGTGTGQVRTITAYVGSTKVASVDTAWAVTPDNTTTYAVSGQMPGVQRAITIT